MQRKRRWFCVAVPLLLLAIGITVCMATRTQVWPEQGDQRVSSGGLTVDYSHAADGYILVKPPSAAKKLKLQIKKGKETYTHDINSQGEWAVYPLQLGSGSYSVLLYQNVSGSKYSKKCSVTFKAKIEDEEACFLCPSVYVWYTADSPAIQKSYELCEGLETDAEKVEAITNYLSGALVYDYIRSVKQTSSYFGDVDKTFETNTGLCQDIAALAAAMLRIQGIPTKLAIGTMTGGGKQQAHAWNYVKIDGKYKRLDVTALITNQQNPTYTADKYY